MRERRMLSPEELLNVTSNIERVNHFVGRKIPSGLVSIEDLKDRPLTSNELFGLVADIERVERMLGNGGRTSNFAQKILYVIAGIPIALAVIDVIFGTDIIGFICSL